MNCHQDKKKIRTIEEKKQLITRLNRVIGQMNGIKRMIEEDRYCDDVLIQLAAADKGIKSLANILLENHMHTCLVEGIKEGRVEIIDEVIELVRRFQ